MGKKINSIYVIGVGQMASGIVQVAAQNGFRVFMMGRSLERTEKGMETIRKNLARALEKGRINEEQYQDTLNNIVCVIDLELAKESELVIEAVSEDEKVKVELFQKLSKICSPEVIFASNTSSISITRLAAQTDRPERFIGMHFFNPVPVMKIVEIVRGLSTSEETTELVRQVGEQMKKEIISVGDNPAFLLNRLLMPLLNEAFYCHMEGVACAEDIDKGMKLAMGHPMGPLQLADFIGLDTVLSILNVMYEGYGETKYFPCPELKRMVDGGCYGVKSGRGYYTYTNKK